MTETPSRFLIDRLRGLRAANRSRESAARQSRLPVALGFRTGRGEPLLVSASFSSRFRLPVQDDRDGRRGFFIRQGVHQEPLTIGRNDVLVPEWKRQSAAHARREQRHRGACLYCLVVGLETYRNAHEPTVEGDVE